MKLRERLPAEALERLYVRDRLTQVRIAKRYGVTQPAIHKLMKEYEIAAQPKRYK